MRLILVRHGETRLNHEKKIQGSKTNIKLNEAGRKQISETAKKIKALNLKIDIIASSPLSRALESADILNNTLKIDDYIRLEPYFIERDYGAFEGIEIEKFYTLRDTVNIDEHYESDYELISRIDYAIKDLLSRNSDKTILLASHSQVIKALLIIAKVPNFDFKSLIHNGSYYVFNVDNDIVKFEKEY